MSTQKKVTLEAHAGEKTIPADKARQELPVLVKVEAPPKAQRAPIDLVALLDVSPSMAWKGKDPNWTRLQLVQAALELAMRRLGAADRLAIVPFSRDVVQPTPLLHMDAKGQADALHRVLSLRVSPYTWFRPALNHAKRILDGRSQEEKARPAFVFLLSDGDDNGGILRQHVDIGYPVHTFGMCQTCSPQAMLHVARENKGTYHPIDDTVTNVALALGNFVGSITSVVATGAVVNFNVPKDSPVRIVKVECGSYAAEWSKRTEGHIDVGVMSANDKKQFVVYLSVPAQQQHDAAAAKDDADKTQVLLEVTGGYSRPDARQRETMDPKEVKVEVKRPSATNPAIITPTTGPEEHNYNVLMMQIVQIHVVNIVQQVVETHVKDDGTAIKHEVMAKELKELWAEFVKNEAPKKKVEQKHLAKGDDTVNKLVGFLETEEHKSIGVLYAHAWLAAEATQQITTFAVSSSTIKTEYWYHESYMALVAEDLVYHATSMVTPPGAGAGADDPCKCVDFDRIDHRLELWSKVKREVPELFQPSEDAESHHLTAVIREASLDAINRAMHQDMYLAVVHASNLRRCYCTGKPQSSTPLPPSPPPPSHDVPTPKGH